jgi:hypothetical protein
MFTGFGLNGFFNITRQPPAANPPAIHSREYFSVVRVLYMHVSLPKR